MCFLKKLLLNINAHSIFFNKSVYEDLHITNIHFLIISNFMFTILKIYKNILESKLPHLRSMLFIIFKPRSPKM